jgi:ketosteroid isomerase-like protein
VKVRVYGDAAVVTGRATIKGQLKTGADSAQDISGQYRYTRVYVKQQGQWRLVSFQFAPVAQLPAQ